MKQVRVVGLRTENVKNLKVVSIEPKENVVVISGKNAAGKSAIIDSVFLAIAGKDALKEYPDPIRHGEKNAKVEVDLGEYIVTRTWTSIKTYLKIENKEGAVFRSPQALLDKMKSDLSFDPAEFAQKSEKEQVHTLMNLLGLSKDLIAFDAEKKQVFDERTIINRQIKDLDAQIKGIELPEILPTEEISTVAVLENYTKATEIISMNKRMRTDLEIEEERIKILENSIADLTNALEQSQNNLANQNVKVTEMRATVESLVDPDLETFKCNVTDAEKTNRQVRLKVTRDELALKSVELAETAKEMTNKLIEIDYLKTEKINEAEMPIDELGFNEHGVTYRGEALKQCSSAEQLRVTVAIAMALNPTLRVIRIADGSLLDSESMAIIEEMAEEKDYQVWIEIVDESGDVGIYIEDGEVSKDNYSEATAEA